MTTNTASNQSFKTLLQGLGKASESQIKSILAEREVVQPEAELTPEIISLTKFCVLLWAIISVIPLKNIPS
ncbi:hypothetical protein RI030_09020 [Aphanizomenon flos-aquae NRERC-008]|jgi:hypothetical protein|uniref:Uncharacterized protein n=1 Tax=Aphanizomenon flos-aquae FACHB-1249 TaxID=2692889 RepID=A0ABR8ISG6_APHFL|nr:MULTISPECIES: hypothetical protein [Aphanizomenon]MCE2904371.1 hypothetical protein [Anabaena sp. CoA2_C59]MDJ0507063.1 hypothetical protein [Nostocales cyanobacterium LE14-WE12]MBD2390292.1 hypothetical protein [Aphanizomenon flos-aquae FACHB-1171]MBD2555575.1 hypothetical protein [Aphanizomenon flos-aquae FACHB-1290]MBD2631426.1 hypothetical protein [Aphanizomenon sp. FACHB-1399]